MTETALPAELRQIDTLHLGNPHVIATYLLLGEEPALVDPGPGSTLATIERGLAANGLAIEDLSAILLTHIHLDHAGATGSLVARNPRLRVFVHQRGAPHMADPERLLRSAARLYGEHMDLLWGEMLPVPEAAITALAGGETINLGRRSLRVFDAPGHASHHVIFLDDYDGSAYIGDDGGIRLPVMAEPTPATPPPDVDLEAWARTLDTLEGLTPERLLLTHFGPANDPEAHITTYRARLAEWAAFVRAGLERGTPEEEQIEGLKTLALATLRADLTDADRVAYLQAAPIAQCWQGLARYLRKRDASLPQ